MPTEIIKNKPIKQDLGLKCSALKDFGFDFVLERGQILFGGGLGDMRRLANLSKPCHLIIGPLVRL